MKKHTTLDLDTRLVREAAAVLGTERITDTVHAALAEVVARRKRAWLAAFPFPGLSPESLAAMRQPRGFDGDTSPQAAQRPGSGTGKS
jgi:hypothetical protein